VSKAEIVVLDKEPIGTISPFIHGHFAEHLGRCCYDGIWVGRDSKIPNMKNIDPSFLDPSFDPGRKYSMPYTWLTLGIGYRKSKVKSVPDSWKYLFESNEYAGRIALLSESADLVRLCAKYLGHSVNGIPPEKVHVVDVPIER